MKHLKTTSQEEDIQSEQQEEFIQNEEQEEFIQSEQQEENIKGEFYGLNEEAELKGINITVTKVEKTDVEELSGGSVNEPKSGYEYVGVIVTIKNNSNENITYNPYDYTIQYSNDYIVGHAIGSIDRDIRLSSGELAPGDTITGSITFEAPIDDQDLTLIYESKLWTGEQLKFKLQ